MYVELRRGNVTGEMKCMTWIMYASLISSLCPAHRREQSGFAEIYNDSRRINKKLYLAEIGLATSLYLAPQNCFQIYRLPSDCFARL